MSVTTYPMTSALAGQSHATISRILKGEWTKLRTLPSTWRTAAFALVFSIGRGRHPRELPGRPVGHHDAQQRATSTRRAARCSAS